MGRVHAVSDARGRLPFPVRRVKFLQSWMLTLDVYVATSRGRARNITVVFHALLAGTLCLAGVPDSTDASGPARGRAGIDLIKMIRLDQDAINGEWRLERGTLVTPGYSSVVRTSTK